MRPSLAAFVVVLHAAFAAPAGAQQDRPPPAPPPAAQQPAGGAPAAASCLLSGTDGARRLFEMTRDLPERSTRAATPLLPLAAGHYSAAAQGSLRMTLSRDTPAVKAAVQDWQRLRFIGAARPDGPATEGHEGIFVDFVGVDDRAATIIVSMPPSRGAWFGERWHVVVGVCTADLTLLGYGVTTVRVSPLWSSLLTTLGAILLLWVLAAYVAARENAQKLHGWWTDHGGATPAKRATWRTAHLPQNRARLFWKGLRAMDPIFISQDALGAGSLGRLQLLVLSFAVIGVVFYVFLRTDAFAGLSSDILALLGITAGGSAFARVAALRRPLGPTHRRILFGTGVIISAEPMPSMRDVLGGGGELDVTRLQAFAFTGFAVVALVSNGVADLAAFTLPPQMLQVLGLSQGVYVVGKLLPAESETTLRQDLDMLSRAAQEAVAAGTDTPAFVQARRAAADSLEQVFAERFNRTRFLELPARDFV